MNKKLLILALMGAIVTPASLLWITSTYAADGRKIHAGRDLEIFRRDLMRAKMEAEKTDGLLPRWITKKMSDRTLHRELKIAREKAEKTGDPVPRWTKEGIRDEIFRRKLVEAIEKAELYGHALPRSIMEKMSDEDFHQEWVRVRRKRYKTGTPFPFWIRQRVREEEVQKAGMSKEDFHQEWIRARREEGRGTPVPRWIEKRAQLERGQAQLERGQAQLERERPARMKRVQQLRVEREEREEKEQRTREDVALTQRLQEKRAEHLSKAEIREEKQATNRLNIAINKVRTMAEDMDEDIARIEKTIATGDLGEKIKLLLSGFTQMLNDIKTLLGPATTPNELGKVTGVGLRVDALRTWLARLKEKQITPLSPDYTIYYHLVLGAHYNKVVAPLLQEEEKIKQSLLKIIEIVKAYRNMMAEVRPIKRWGKLAKMVTSAHTKATDLDSEIATAKGNLPENMKPFLSRFQKMVTDIKDILGKDTTPDDHGVVDGKGLRPDALRAMIVRMKKKGISRISSTYKTYYHAILIAHYAKAMAPILLENNQDYGKLSQHYFKDN